MKKIVLLIAVLGLSACGKTSVECHSEETIGLIKGIIWDSVVKAVSDEELLLNEEEFKKNLFVDYARATAFDEKIHKYSCAGTIRYQAVGISEFGKSLDERGVSRMTALRADRKAAVRSPLRYSALSYLSDNQALLSHVIKNSDASGYSFKTEFSSQEVGADHYAEVLISPMNSLAFYVVAALSTPEKPENNSASDSIEMESKQSGEKFVLTDKEKGIVKKASENFDKTYAEKGVAGVIAERDQCYQAAAGIKESTLTIQCVAYDYASSAMITTLETSQNFPITPSFTKADVRIRALESVENTMSVTLDSKAMRESFLTAIESELVK